MTNPEPDADDALASIDATDAWLARRRDATDAQVADADTRADEGFLTRSRRLQDAEAEAAAPPGPGMRPNRFYELATARRDERRAAAVAARRAARPPRPASAPSATSTTAWAKQALANLADEVASTHEGARNDTLNRTGLRGYRVADAAGIDSDDVTDQLTVAARTSGLDDREIAATLRSARQGADAYGPADLPKGDARTPHAPDETKELPIDAPRQVMTVDQARAVFCKWLGNTYDTDALLIVLVALAVERLDGDPVWVMMISGSGNAKTETVQAASGAGALVTSTVSSAGALLSGTSARERATDATGGLLRKIGPRGALVIKDFTSMLAMNRDARNEVLAAFREIFDGYWSRNVGTDGGRTLDWTGRIVVIAAVTSAYDRAHTVIASMGDRFVVLRPDSTKHRKAAGRQAIRNTGSEKKMRDELAAAVVGVVAGMTPGAATVDEADHETLLDAADLVTRARTAVEYDYRGDVEDAHAPEAPTRFAKQLAQIVRGGKAIGLTGPEAMRLAIRCARDSMPPLRLAILDYLADNPHSLTAEVRKGIDKPRNTVDRQLQALHMLGVLTCDEQEYSPDRSRWYYTLAEDVDPDVLRLENCSRHTPSPQRRGWRMNSPLPAHTNKSGIHRALVNHHRKDEIQCLPTPAT